MTTTPNRLLIATNNPGKVREYQEILQTLLPGVDLLTLREAGVDFEVEETGTTFEENARLKATEYAARSGMVVIADDSGIEVDALQGFPGLKSARWTGPTDGDRVRGLLELLKDVPEERRGARFVCWTVCRAPDGREAMAQGTVEGRVGWEPSGAHGFGYDPIFVLPERGMTMAELPRDEKNGLSHRGRAARVLAPEVARLLGGER